ncbi:MAG: hypothetical protein ABJI00_11830, partial [Paracoccaceae bacterium]
IHWLRNIFFSLFGLPFLTVGLFTAASGVGHLASMTVGDLAFGVFLAAFSVPFIGAGGAMVFGPWIADHYVPRRTKYALTNKAGYVATRYWTRSMDVFPIRAETRIELTEHRSGASTVNFHFEETRDSDGDQTTVKKGFSDIEDGATVYRLIRDIQAEKGAGPQ